MGTEKKKLKPAGERSEKPLQLKEKKNKASHKKEKLKLDQSVELNYEGMEETKTDRSSGKKRRDREKGSNVEAAKIDQYNIKYEAYKSDKGDRVNKKGKLSRKRKANKVMTGESGIDKADELDNEMEDGFNKQNRSQVNRESKARKKRRKDEKRKKAGEDKVDELHREVEDGFKEKNAKSKEARKSKKKDRALSRKDEKMLDEKGEPEQNEVYEISSGDEDCSRGMKKWVTEYHQSRPGLKVLQDRIDDFILAHEAQEEQERKEREALAAEGGWTVVVHHKGRKKTTDAESGTTVGSAAPAAVLENMAKKKRKEVGSDFYRFQKREAQMNEIMALQSKFEQDKKRIQQLRAARKFRPY